MKEFLKENMDVDSFIQSLLIKYVTARIDIKNVGNKDNSIEIISTSDSCAKINFPEWFKDETGSGLIIQSEKCFLYLEIKCINKGSLNIRLRGPYVKDKNDKQFPTYIDYIKLTINDEDYLDDNKLVWHNTPYKIQKNVEDGEIIKIYVEWLPFNDLSVL